MFPDFLIFIEDRTAIDGKADAGDQVQDQQEEAERYRRATFALLDKIRRCSDEELQELLRSIRDSNSLAEAMQQTLDFADR